MALSDLIPWNRERNLPAPRRAEDPFWSLQREMNRMFEDFARGFDVAPWYGAAGSGWSFQPTLDVHENDDEVRITAELPGLEEKDFELSLSNGVLTLRGEKRQEHEEREGERVHRIERSHGAFERSLALPCEVESDKAEARFKAGVLTVTLTKAPSARRNVRRIEVKTS